MPAVDDDGAAVPPALDSAAKDDVWARVQLARNLRRPRTLEFVDAMADDFVELHGDRLFGDDAAIVAGLARIDGRRVAVIGQQKGADTDENIRRNFGMPHPEGYRKAMRVMELAERVGPAGRHVRRRARRPSRPESEERGIAEAIARSIGLMTRLRTPIVTVITGEGGSGGALAIAVGDVVDRARERGLLASSARRAARRSCGARPTRRRPRPPRCGCPRPTSTPSASSTSSSPSPARARTPSPRRRRDRLRAIIVDRLDALARAADRRRSSSSATGATGLWAPTLRSPSTEVPGRVDRSLADRLRDLLDPARRGLAGVEVWSRDDDPPAREEV